MTPSKILSVAVAAAVLSLAPPARADFPAPALYIGLYGGGTLVLRDWDLGATTRPRNLLPDHSAMVGGRLGFHILSRLAVEAEVAWLPLSTQGGDGSQNHALAYDIELLFHMLRGDWTPVLEAGVGGYTNLSGTLGGDTDPRVHLGLGLRGLVLPWMAVRIDIRDVVSDGMDKWGANNLELTAGLDFFVWRGHQAPSDRDHDGIVDGEDACPDVAGPRETRGCPDSDGDGVVDKDDRCPQTPGLPALAGCPDKDGDGITDAEDLCPDVAAGRFPDAARKGCPADRDGDGVIDELDQCPDLAQGKHPDPARKGCPNDRDQDGVLDDKDQCIDVPAGASPDPARPGCPGDRDGDSVPDQSDACPDKAGAPDPDPKKNGCPGLVEIKGGQIVILQQVFFASNKDVILEKSFPVLQAVSHAMKSLPAERTFHVEGHTDNTGIAEKNLDLSKRRAASVKRWLVEHGIAANRLEAQGFGQERPIADNKTVEGKAKNRRVEFHIVDDNAPK